MTKNLIKVAPSILAADFSCLADEIVKVEIAGADMIHLDIMDGHFVPNLTFGPPVVAAIRKVTNLPFDVHLMVNNPEDLIEPFKAAGADIITVHAESTPHLNRLVERIKELDMRAGVALNPATPLASITEIISFVDMALLMSVNPGFGGQKFIPGTINKIQRLSRMIKEWHLNVAISVDGGINETLAADVVNAGATILVAGSSVYAQPNARQTIRLLRGAAATI